MNTAEMIEKSKKRFAISSTFIYTDPDPANLFAMIRDKAENIPNYESLILLDFNRTHRSQKQVYTSGRKYFETLMTNEKNKVGLFKFPRKAKKQDEQNVVNKDGFAEIFGVHHYKFLVSDDSVMLLGGNHGFKYYRLINDRSWII